MAWTPFTYGDTIDSDEINNNFYWGAQGDWLPMGGVNLENTDSAYNIGSDDYKWNNVYVETAYVYEKMQGCFCEMARIEVTSPTSRVEITGINGDQECLWEVNVFNKVVNTNSASRISFYFNGDSSANYIRGFAYSLGSTTTIAVNQTVSNIQMSLELATTTSMICSSLKAYMYTKTGRERHWITSLAGHVALGDIKYNMIMNSSYLDTSTTITSFVIEPLYDDMDTTTVISLYALIEEI